jgi:hypothetical protein
MSHFEFPEKSVGLYVKNNKHQFYLDIIKAWKDNTTKWEYVLEGDIKKNWDDYIFLNTDFSRIPGAARDDMRNAQRVYIYCSFNNFGCLLVSSDNPLSEKQFDILLRFAKVFNLTYTRFDDLQRAEAQAREAQIELALERIRARTMAMQKSEELNETSHLLYQQLIELGEPADQISIGIINEEEGVIEVSSTVKGAQFQQTFKHLIDDPSLINNKIYQGWKANKKSALLEFKGEELVNYNRFRNRMVGREIFPTEVLKDEQRTVLIG